MARTLATQFTNLVVHRFPDREYASYKQVMIIGVKRDKPLRDAEKEKELKELSKLEPEAIPQMEFQSVPSFTVPNTPARIPTFLSPVFLAEEAAEIERMSGLWGTLGQWLTPPQTELTDNPPLPLHTGHQASLLASGALNGVLGMGENRHLVRGLVIKETKVEEEEEEDAHGNTVTVSREVESFRIKISAVTAAGKLVELT